MATLEAAVQQASGDHIIAAGAGLGKANPAYPFLDPSGQIATQSQQQSLQEYLDEVLGRAPSTQEIDELSSFVAIGTCSHVLDGWRYLSHAASALLNGSRRTCIHLAYYAELRAARSILGAFGIAIRNTLHFAVTKDRRVVTFGALNRPTAAPVGPFRQILNDLAGVYDDVVRRIMRRPPPIVPRDDEPIGTHAAAWKALREWVKNPDHAERVVRAFGGLIYENVDWVEACRSTAMRVDVVAHWLQNWSCDLKSLSADSGARNAASYGVDLSSDTFRPVQQSELDAVRDANEACLSWNGEPTDQIQLMLICDFIVKAARRLEMKKNDMWKKVRQYLENEAAHPPKKAKGLVTLIKKMPDQAAGRVFSFAADRKSGATGVFCRALLLLRLATALMREQWKEIRTRSSGGAAAWQDKWLEEFACHAHVDVTSTPMDFHDLETDHEDALDEIKSWLGANSFNPNTLWQNVSVPLREICRLERAGLWAAAI
jgi:hypothetical protein